MLSDLRRAVVVFDLDDTLYPEADYVDSGVRRVCEEIEALYGKKIHPNLSKALVQDPKVDWLALACQQVKLPSSAKDSLLWLYRLHIPDIRLPTHAREVLNSIQSASKKVAILTDGRSITQRLKLRALGLGDLDAYISEDYGAPKPCPDRFRAIQEDYPAQHYIYVADNVQKDFLGCNPLGWIGIGMRANERNVHSQALVGLSEAALPAYWVNGWSQLAELLLNSKLRPQRLPSP